VEEHFTPVAAQFMPHLVAAAPHRQPPVLAWRVRWALFPMVGALLSEENPYDSVAPDLDSLVNHVVTSAVGALTAPEATTG